MYTQVKDEVVIAVVITFVNEMLDVSMCVQVLLSPSVASSRKDFGYNSILSYLTYKRVGVTTVKVTTIE